MTDALENASDAVVPFDAVETEPKPSNVASPQPDDAKHNDFTASGPISSTELKPICEAETKSKPQAPVVLRDSKDSSAKEAESDPKTRKELEKQERAAKEVADKKAKADAEKQAKAAAKKEKEEKAAAEKKEKEAKAALAKEKAAAEKKEKEEKAADAKLQKEAKEKAAKQEKEEKAAVARKDKEEKAAAARLAKEEKAAAQRAKVDDEKQAKAAAKREKEEKAATTKAGKQSQAMVPVSRGEVRSEPEPEPSTSTPSGYRSAASALDSPDSRTSQASPSTTSAASPRSPDSAVSLGAVDVAAADNANNEDNDDDDTETHSRQLRGAGQELEQSMAELDDLHAQLQGLKDEFGEDSSSPKPSSALKRRPSRPLSAEEINEIKRRAALTLEEQQAQGKIWGEAGEAYVRKVDIELTAFSDEKRTTQERPSRGTGIAGAVDDVGSGTGAGAASGAAGSVLAPVFEGRPVVLHGAAGSDKQEVFAFVKQPQTLGSLSSSGLGLDSDDSGSASGPGSGSGFGSGSAGPSLYWCAPSDRGLGPARESEQRRFALSELTGLVISKPPHTLAQSGAPGGREPVLVTLVSAQRTVGLEVRGQEEAELWLAGITRAVADSMRKLLVERQDLARAGANPGTDPANGRLGPRRFSVQGTTPLAAAPAPAHKSTYVGSTDGRGRRQGQGTYTHSAGSKYEGEWLGDRKHGKGKYWFPNGDWYEGEFRQGEITGEGTYFYRSGSTYTGTFLAGSAHGHGVYTHSLTGYRYQGTWAKDRREGSAVCHYRNGSRFEGTFHAGCKEGQGTVHFASKARFEGKFAGDRPAAGIFHLVGGDRYQAEWVNGQCFTVKLR